MMRDLQLAPEAQELIADAPTLQVARVRLNTAVQAQLKLVAAAGAATEQAHETERTAYARLVNLQHAYGRIVNRLEHQRTEAVPC